MDGLLWIVIEITSCIYVQRKCSPDASEDREEQWCVPSETNLPSSLSLSLYLYIIYLYKQHTVYV